MKELKPIDYKLLFELMKNSHRSDRQLAKALGVSQPTVTRRRAMLEKITSKDTPSYQNLDKSDLKLPHSLF